MTASDQTEQAKAIADAAKASLTTGLPRLREPFPASQVGKLPKGGVELDYVGHGAVTDRLLEVDPLWSWRPLAYDQGLPRFTLDANGNPIAFWIELTVCGVTRLGCGTCRANQFDAEKVLIGDAIRNAAMRFGVALDLWIRGHAEDDEKRTNADDGQAPVRGTVAPPPTDEQKARTEAAAVLKALSEEDRKVIGDWCDTHSIPRVASQWTDDQLAAVREAIDNLPAEASGE